MSFLPLAAIVVAFWFYVHLKTHHVATILPLTTATRLSNVLYSHKGFTVERSSLLVVRIKSSSLFLNSHAKLLARCRAKGLQWQTFWKFFYDIGSLVAIAGQLSVLILLAILVLQMGNRALGEPELSPNLTKRSVEPVNLKSAQSLKPLIPGITVPLSHAFPILLSLVVCTAIHETGHAISGALDGIPLVSWGYAVILAIPAAFVQLSDKERPYSSRIRIASAGSYHNVMTLLLLSSLSIIRADHFFWKLIGYADAKSGIVVYNVEPDSPLRDFITPGSIITQLDDVRLTSNSNYTAQDLWSFVLTGSHPGDGPGAPGWCVDKLWFNGLSTHCCQDAKLGSCFHRYSQDGKPGCLDPIPIFEDASIKRCVSDTSCHNSDEYTCVRPDSSAELLRIAVRPSPEERDHIIVWKGPRSEIVEQTTVGRYFPRIHILPASLPHLLSVLVRYIKTVSLSLFFFNLLPVRSLDGSEVLIAFLCLVLPARPSEDRLDDLERGGLEAGESVWQRRARPIQKGFEKVTLLLIGLGGILFFVFG